MTVNYMQMLNGYDNKKSQRRLQEMLVSQVSISGINATELTVLAKFILMFGAMPHCH